MTEEGVRSCDVTQSFFFTIHNFFVLFYILSYIYYILNINSSCKYHLLGSCKKLNLHCIVACWSLDIEYIKGVILTFFKEFPYTYTRCSESFPCLGSQRPCLLPALTLDLNLLYDYFMRGLYNYNIYLSQLASVI